MVDVFISYARKERAKAERIKAELSALGLHVFFDVEGIDGGADFPTTIDRAVKSAHVVLGCWTEYAFTRSWVMQECRVGKARNVLVPVALENFAQMSVPIDFFDTNYLDLTTFDGTVPHEGWSQTLKAIGKHLKRDLTIQPKPAPKAEPTTAPTQLPLAPPMAPRQDVHVAQNTQWRFDPNGERPILGRIVVEAELTLDGELRCQQLIVGLHGRIRGGSIAAVDADVRGQMLSRLISGYVQVGENSAIYGDLYATRAVVSGMVDGNVFADRLSLNATAHIGGAVRVGVSEITRNAVIQAPSWRSHPNPMAEAPVAVPVIAPHAERFPLLQYVDGLPTPPAAKPSKPAFLQPKKKAAPAQTGRATYLLTSIIPAGARIVGDIDADGMELQIDGDVTGSIRGGSVTIGDTGRVTGAIVAESCVVHGAVDGTLRARRVQLARNAHFIGDILHQSLNAEMGAVFEGQCRYLQDPLAGFELPLRTAATADLSKEIAEWQTALRSNPAGQSLALIASSGMTIYGSIVSSGEVHVDGRVEGQVLARDATIGETGFVAGSVRATNITIYGRVARGIAGHTIKLAAAAHVEGPVSYHRLSALANNVIEGSVHRMGDQTAYLA